MLNLKEYIDGIKPLLNVPADYTPNCYYGESCYDMRVRFQLQMAQLPKSFDFARTVIHPDSFLLDCSFTLTKDETDPSHVSCQILYWFLRDYLIDSQYQFRDLMERMHDNKFLPDKQKKYRHNYSCCAVAVHAQRKRRRTEAVENCTLLFCCCQEKI